MTHSARAEDPARAREFALALVTARPSVLQVNVSLEVLEDPEQLDQLVVELRDEFDDLEARLRGG